MMIIALALFIIVTVLLAAACIKLLSKINRNDSHSADEREAIERYYLNDRQKFQERSKIVNKGLISQEMVPLMPGFPYAFKDARRAVHPLDYIVFDGLSDGDVKEVIFLEIKTGKT